MHGANRTGRPFTGDHAGILLYATLHKFGFASQAEALDPGDGLRLIDCRITNAVKCLPPDNKPVGAEINTCNAYLAAELGTLPAGAVVLALGGIAHRAVVRALGLRQAAIRFAHEAQHDARRHAAARLLPLQPLQHQHRPPDGRDVRVRICTRTGVAG